MSEISRVALFGKLNPVLYKAIEGATVFCKLRGNPYVELVHWLTQMLETNDSDLQAIVRHYALDQAALARDVTASLDRLPRGSTAISDFSEHITIAIEQAWVYGTLMFGDSQVRSAYLLLGMLKTPSLRNALVGISRQFEKIKADDLAEQLDDDLREDRRVRPRRAGRLDRRRRRAGRDLRGDGAGGDGQAGGAEEVHDRPDREGAQGRDRSGHRPRRGDPPDRRHPDAAPPEQPDPHRRGRRRQDRGGRGLRPADRARRRAAAAARRLAAARSTSACCRPAPA